MSVTFPKEQDQFLATILGRSQPSMTPVSEVLMFSSSLHKAHTWCTYMQAKPYMYKIKINFMKIKTETLTQRTYCLSNVSDKKHLETNIKMF